jgi:Skp family chaperone for outer membrane proteins
VRSIALAVALVVAGHGASAQDPGQVERIAVPSPILTIDQDGVYAASRFGQRIAREIEARASLLAAENRRIEAELAAEELVLTEVRPTLTPEDFRARADAFDARVEAIRTAQDSKARALGTLREAARDAFWRDSLPALGQLLAERRAVAVLDRRVVFLAANAIDVTDDAVARIDAVLGDGPGLDGLPTPDTPAPDTPAPDTPAPDTPAPVTPTPVTPTPATPDPETLDPGTPAAPADATDTGE